jgi:hypothetical protein
MPDLRPEGLEQAREANLLGYATSEAAKALVRELAERYSRPTKGNAYKRKSTMGPYERAVGAFLLGLLEARGDDDAEGWMRLPVGQKEFPKGSPVTYRMFKSVREAWKATALVEEVTGYPGMLAFGNPGPSHGRMTRFRATDTLIRFCVKRGITPENVGEHFHRHFVMPNVLIRFTAPAKRVPDTKEAVGLQQQVTAINTFLSRHNLSPKRHDGFVRLFHQQSFTKGGRLYSQPPWKDSNYQYAPEQQRLEMRIDGAEVVEIDISASYLTIFYSWFGVQLPLNEDAYEGVLSIGPMDRVVTKFWINASFGNSGLIGRWTADMKGKFRKRYGAVIDPKQYPAKAVREAVLLRHPKLQRWGQEINGKLRTWGDLMFTESQVIISAMERLMAEGVPSYPVFDSIIVPSTKGPLAAKILQEQFKTITGVQPRLKLDNSHLRYAMGPKGP